ncbi:transcription initiation factor IIF, beta subunit domain-containing protein [Rhizoctonia solani AG-1 IA]|uniref:Transcription initiation factor IIF subunit beta n=1 Tax=Thanatephorus cucumeris (strain AG1-IA) TaxID=983506 RepID=L8WQK1_THACA|nr:transcription initiation factor IIF, beta subunit domain-containing protein [Rhizoctonia solani AG-1 IA]
MEYDEPAPRARDSDLDSNSDSDEEGPNEDLVIRGASGTVWLVKVPRTVMESWMRIDKDGEDLGTLRVYHETEPPVIQLLLSNDPSLKESLRGAVFTLTPTAVRPKNMFVISETTPIQTDMRKTAIIKRPTAILTVGSRLFNIAFTKANEPRRQLIQIDDGNAQIKKIASGAGHLGNFSNMVKQKPKPAAGQFERAARIPKNELLDMLFKLFMVQSHWSMKVLRERTKQPLDYLKETLEEIAILHKSGPHTNTWSLQASYAQQFGAPPPEANAATSSMNMVESDEDEDEDEDMDEVTGI